MTSEAPEPERPAQGLDEALARMHWAVEPGIFGLASFPRQLVADLDFDLGPHAQVTFEPDKITILALEDRLEPMLARWPQGRVHADLAWIRFETSMGWEVVGFLALVCTRLAQAGVPLGAVCSFDRDHLFVARRFVGRVESVLGELFGMRDPGLIR